jgi:hypothetical protein
MNTPLANKKKNAFIQSSDKVIIGFSFRSFFIMIFENIYLILIFLNLFISQLFSYT